MEYVFKADALSKSYGKCEALSALSMRIPTGSIYGFVGRNGAGKTTLIRLLCGLQRPTGGEYELFGTRHTDKGIELARHRLGAMVEAPAVYMDMTAEENLRKQYRILGCVPPGGARDLLRLVGLSDTGRKKARHFSQGMRQKLGIAMAMAGEPELLILDEPVNGLDPQGIIELRELIARLHQEAHVTVLLSSHILGELSKLATHYGFIDRGRMVKEMTAEELERACLKSTRVEVSDVRALAAALDRKGIPYRIVSGAQADILAPVSLTKLAVELVGENCEIYTCREQNETLETYFMRLVGGDGDA